jgi:hypothetical protein
VGSDFSEDFQEKAAAGEVGASSVDLNPFVNAADAFGAELSAEPRDVIDENDAFDAEASGLDCGGTGGFVASDDEKIGFDDGCAADCCDEANEKPERGFCERVHGCSARFAGGVVGCVSQDLPRFSGNARLSGGRVILIP